MKVVVLFLAALLGSGYASSYDSQQLAMLIQHVRERDATEQILTYLEEVCPNRRDDFEENLLSLKECAIKLPYETKTACQIVRTDFQECLQPLINTLESCVPANSREVPMFIFDSLKSGVEYICKTDGEHIIELSNQCIKKMQWRSQRCNRRMESKIQQYKKSSPSKSDLCDIAQSMKPCMLNHLQTSCTNAITRESVVGLIDAITKPCFSNSLNEIETIELVGLE